MREAHGRSGRAAARATVLASLLAGSSAALALDPALDVSQYVHTSWRGRDGFAKGSGINALAQTPDGYLWLGTDSGLLRFDGIQTVPWPPDPREDLPSSPVVSLLAARDGSLWIGTSKGLARWKDGRLTPIADLAGHYVFALVEDREGVVWAGGVTVPTGNLCAIGQGAVQCYGDGGRFGRGVLGLYEDTRGNLWAGVFGGIWRWKPGPPRFVPLPGKRSLTTLAEDDDGALLVGGTGGILRIADETAQPYVRP